MRVRWTKDAADDLERICDYIAESRPESARRVAQSVVERIGTLEAFRTSDAPVASRIPERSPSLRSRSSQSTKYQVEGGTRLGDLERRLRKTAEW
jgi:plasmid stabilization system protein ParE